MSPSFPSCGGNPDKARENQEDPEERHPAQCGPNRVAGEDVGVLDAVAPLYGSVHGVGDDHADDQGNSGAEENRGCRRSTT